MLKSQEGISDTGSYSDALKMFVSRPKDRALMLAMRIKSRWLRVPMAKVLIKAVKPGEDAIQAYLDFVTQVFFQRLIDDVKDVSMKRFSLLCLAIALTRRIGVQKEGAKKATDAKAKRRRQRQRLAPKRLKPPR